MKIGKDEMAQVTEAIKNNIVVLTGEETFSVWQFQVKLALDGMDVFDVVDGSAEKPEDSERDKLAIWKRKDKKARNVIGTSVHFNLVKLIMYCETSKEMWDKLHSVFYQKSQIGIHILQKQFFTLEKEPGESMASHIAKLEDIAHRLATLKEPISKSMLMTKILLSLPNEYGHFHVAWDSTEEKDKTLHNLRNRLMGEEARMTMNDDHKGESSLALYCKFCKKKGHDKKRCGKRLKNKFGKSVTCFKCKKPGHMQNDCPEDDESDSDEDYQTDEQFS